MLNILRYFKKLFFIRHFIAFIYNINKNFKLLKSQKAILISSKSFSDELFTIKQDTIETGHVMKVIDLIEDGKIYFNSPSISVKKFKGALFFSHSDLILIDDKAVWFKSEYSQFNKILPLDKDLLKRKGSLLYIKKPNKIIHIKNGFSMCGVHSDVWSHFLVEYLPKIEHIQKIINLTNEEITIIIPQYNDNNIKEILDGFFKSINRISVVELKNGEAAFCEYLFYIENASRLTEHSSYVCPSDMIIPGFVLSFLKENFINNRSLFPTVYDENIVPFRKLYIKRTVSKLSPLSSLRILRNHEEVENFFLKNGFEIITPHEFTLAEKRKIFNEALFVVGPYSSGFMNVIFCKPKTTVLIFTNFQRIYELYLSSLASAFDIKLFALTGIDDDSSDIHSSYSISLDKIIRSYNSLSK